MTQERILIIGLNWIGDAIMSMPAIQACRAENPQAHITVLVKPYLKPLWEMHPVPDDILCLEKKTAANIAKLRALDFDKACILPNSFRSAFLPTMAGIRHRIGLKGELRSLMLTQVVPLAGGHQSNEYFPILAPASVELVREQPELNVPDAAFPGLENYAVLMPGAARGASKMWPLSHFEELAKRILAETDLALVFAGGAADASACEELSERLGRRSTSVAGKTNLKEWTGLLKNSRVAIANDSGGMHLAAAVGTPVVGIYGITDPDKTGPLARRFRVVQNSTVKAREISRNSELATQALASISPEQVFRAVQELLA
ncbi:ADP-heptose--LPS heptosyltransferase 2 [Pontiella desulfatans]|uniref:lipopolysaccharide heptosyltransferase II n=2 Tax=Pontiella desulfatans TaxID=2750659 RepID=A0A6C2U193_PONDE|nr:ADP-heptose--LPS heptosyltransferase 2 [Pontiella desulfatans]